MDCISRGGLQGIRKDSFCPGCSRMHFWEGVFDESADGPLYRYPAIQRCYGTNPRGLGAASKIGDNLLADTMVNTEMLLWIRRRVELAAECI